MEHRRCIMKKWKRHINTEKETRNQETDSKIKKEIKKISKHYQNEKTPGGRKHN